MTDLFRWQTVDVRTRLPDRWQERLKDLAQVHHKDKILRTNHSTSRERNPDLEILSKTVGGIVVKERAPWLVDFYRGLFRDLAQDFSTEPVFVMRDERFGCVMNVQIGDSERYECHVDSNPIEGLLYVTSHPEGAGGELVVANSMESASPDEVDADCSVIYPQAGHLVFFDARRRSHYVRALSSAKDVRIVVAMNFYVPSCPEETRPDDLNIHLSGRP